MRPVTNPDPLLTPGEVAALFGVDPKTVKRWANAGKLTVVRTLGNHRRFRETEVNALLDAGATARAVAPDSPEMLARLGLDGRRT